MFPLTSFSHAKGTGRTFCHVVNFFCTYPDWIGPWCWCREGEQGTLFDWAANWKLLRDHSGACLGDFSLKQGMTPLSQAHSSSPEGIPNSVISKVYSSIGNPPSLCPVVPICPHLWVWSFLSFVPCSLPGTTGPPASPSFSLQDATFSLEVASLGEYRCSTSSGLSPKGTVPPPAGEILDGVFLAPLAYLIPISFCGIFLVKGKFPSFPFQWLFHVSVTSKDFKCPSHSRQVLKLFIPALAGMSL